MVHYDIGDCLRSCCNPAGEETLSLETVHFDIDLCRAILSGYLSVAGGVLSDWDLHYLPDCIRLIPLELGLRFLTDHLNGNVYFHCDREDHNLHRAAVEFQLTESVEQQMPELRQLIDHLVQRQRKIRILPLMTSPCIAMNKECHLGHQFARTD